MSVVNGIITAPINVKDPYTAMGLGTYNGWYDVGYVCSNQHDRINIFSRVKPVRFDSVADITDSDRRSVGHGISIHDIITGSTVQANHIMDSAYNEWYYDPPRGAAYNEPYRLTDFNNYYHYAVPPIQVIYPASGWQINNTSERYLQINIDYDPGEYTLNLQATDFVNKLDLKKCYVYAALCKYDDTVIGVYETSTTILDEVTGELNSPGILIPVSGLSQMNPNYMYRIYMAIGYFENNLWNFIPLPKQGDYNPPIMYMNVISNPSEGGGGVSDPAKDVSFSPSFGSVYHTAEECVEEEGGNYVMRNDTGDLLIKVKLTNTSSQPATWKRADFSLSQYYSGTVSKYATAIFKSQPTNMGGSVESITVPANGTITFWLYFEAIFSNIKSTAVNTTVEIDFKRSGYPIFNGALNYCHGTIGWITK